MSTGFTPSQFLRAYRPESYSDTAERTTYSLEREVFDHFLSEITAKNRTHDFEIFCQKLCSRVIAPNLRPQTGPDGGGDSKADTDTFPVADEISRIFTAEPNSGREYWAFAFSAKADWRRKARSDVEGLIATGRPCDRIMFVTNQNAKAKVRAELELELSQLAGCSVTICDRTWIVDQVIDHNHKDLAVHYLKVGHEVRGAQGLGPLDYSRQQQLDEVETALADPEQWTGCERQRVNDAIRATRLSRNLAKPRVESDGRAERAVRLAHSNGSQRQIHEAEFERIWGPLWYFDDFAFLEAEYDLFAANALSSDHAAILQYVASLHQMLGVAVQHGHLTRQQAKFDERTVALLAALERVAAMVERPNNSLEARFMVIYVEHLRDRLTEGFVPSSDIWRKLGDILDGATGLIEFNFQGIVQLIEVLGAGAGNDPAYDDLVDKLATAVGARHSEGEAALIRLKRAKTMSLDRHMDLIRMLGKIIVGLNKKEYRQDLAEAQHLLMLAYMAADLFWAARATGYLLATSLIIEGEIEDQLPEGIIPTFKYLAWSGLRLGHLPEAMFSASAMWGLGNRLPLDEPSKQTLQEETDLLHSAIACALLRASETDLPRMTHLPDILGRLNLSLPSAALLYRLGHFDAIPDGLLPQGDTLEAFSNFMNILAGQPFAKSLRDPLILNLPGTQTASTIVLGIKVAVVHQGTDTSILAAEAILGSIEAFFATILHRQVAPYRAAYTITIVESDDVPLPELAYDEGTPTATVRWPAQMSPATYGSQSDVVQCLIQLAGIVLGSTCLFDDHRQFIESLFEDEAVHHRVSLIPALANLRSRVSGRNVAKLSDWAHLVGRDYPVSPTRPSVQPSNISDDDDDDDAVAEDQGDVTEGRERLHKHTDLEIKTVIDMQAWTHGHWSSVAYAVYPSPAPPLLGLVFDDPATTAAIFRNWLEQLGPRDTLDDIYISIVLDLPGRPAMDYAMMITARIEDDNQKGRIAVTATQIKLMEPQSTRPRDMFLQAFAKTGMYYLVPGFVAQNGALSIEPKLAIAKRALKIMRATDVQETDPEWLALKSVRELVEAT